MGERFLFRGRQGQGYGEWERRGGGVGTGDNVRIWTIVARWWERSWKRTVGFGDEGDSGWGYDPGPNECRKDIGKQDIGFDNGLNGGKNDMLGDNAGEWMGEGLESCLRSTKILLAEECVLRQT